MTLLQSSRPDIPAYTPAASRFAVGVAEAGLFCLAALVISLPGGLLPFGLCLLGSSLAGWSCLRAARREMGTTLRVLAWLMAAVLAMSLLSIYLFEHGFRDVDNRSRFVVLPWTAIWAYALQPRTVWLWRGAVAGTFVAAALAVVQVGMGASRAEGWTNAIVFADIVLVLMVLVVLCRPGGKLPWLLAALALGCVAIVLSGSRGVWLGLLGLLVMAIWGARWRSRRTRWLVLGAGAAIAATLLLTVPGLSSQMRIVELQKDMERLEEGDSDSSAGARIERLQVAYDTFAEHPLTGIGVGHFDEAMKRLPVCQTDKWVKRCHLGHAHNDVAEWGATQGVPGLLLLLAIYALPLWLFARLHRRSGNAQFRGPAAAGIMVVVSYVLCGLTQSMFAHQVTASFYVCMVGVLAGLALRECERAAAARPPR
ncbi:MAG TPA: polymerase [Xanthomonadaceae bacterium]|nr:polymerase [Xanthomonadaceae bacterium]